MAVKMQEVSFQTLMQEGSNRQLLKNLKKSEFCSSRTWSVFVDFTLQGSIFETILNWSLL